MTKNDHHFSADNGSIYVSQRVSGKLKIKATLVAIFAALASSNPAYSNAIAAEANAPVQNDKPVATTDRVDLKSSSIAINTLANDVDANGDRLILVDASARFGAVVFTTDGLLAYAQNPGPARADTITYVVSDDRGGFDQGTVEILAP